MHRQGENREGFSAVGVLVASKKQAGGKLVRVRLSLAGTTLSHVQISGDFFLMPPEKLASVEKFLTGWDTASVDSEGQLARRLEKFLAREGITVSGMSTATIAEVVHEAARAGGVQ